MRTISLLIFTAIIFLFSACNKEKLQRDRLHGMWIYEKAKLQVKVFCREDILDEYLYQDVYFTSDGDIKIIDVKNNTFYEGHYIIEEDDNTYTDAEGNVQYVTKTQMAITLTDTTTKETFVELWDQVDINKNKIRFEQKLNGKDVYFVLRRQTL